MNHRDRVILNTRRKALQVENCDGSALIAHLPVTLEQLANLGMAAGFTRGE